MLFKLLTLAGALLAFWGLLQRATGAVAPRGRSGGAEDLVRCAACGAWRAPGAECGCAVPPTP